MFLHITFICLYFTIIIDAKLQNEVKSEIISNDMYLPAHQLVKVYGDVHVPKAEENSLSSENTTKINTKESLGAVKITTNDTVANHASKNKLDCFDVIGVNTPAFSVSKTHETPPPIVDKASTKKLAALIYTTIANNIYNSNDSIINVTSSTTQNVQVLTPSINDFFEGENNIKNILENTTTISNTTFSKLFINNGSTQLKNAKTLLKIKAIDLGIGTTSKNFQRTLNVEKSKTLNNNYTTTLKSNFTVKSATLIATKSVTLGPQTTQNNLKASLPTKQQYWTFNPLTPYTIQSIIEDTNKTSRKQNNKKNELLNSKENIFLHKIDSEAEGVNSEYESNTINKSNCSYDEVSTDILKTKKLATSIESSTIENINVSESNTISIDSVSNIIPLINKVSAVPKLSINAEANLSAKVGSEELNRSTTVAVKSTKDEKHNHDENLLSVDAQHDIIIRTNDNQIWKPFQINCLREVDEYETEVCKEWAKAGLCKKHRATMFLFCRRTCLCIGPPKHQRNKLERFQKVIKKIVLKETQTTNAINFTKKNDEDINVTTQSTNNSNEMLKTINFDIPKWNTTSFNA